MPVKENSFVRRHSEGAILYWVSVVMVSRAPETAPIEQSFCRALPPAVYRNIIAFCGMASTVSGIAPPHTAFRLVVCHLNTSIASIKAQHLPLKEPHFSLLFFHLLSASPSALPSYQDATLSNGYPFPVWRWSDQWSSEWLTHWDPCYCHFIGNWPIHITP